MPIHGTTIVLRAGQALNDDMSQKIAAAPALGSAPGTAWALLSTRGRQNDAGIAAERLRP
jgi:hypothetical protein